LFSPFIDALLLRRVLKERHAPAAEQRRCNMLRYAMRENERQRTTESTAILFEA